MITKHKKNVNTQLYNSEIQFHFHCSFLWEKYFFTLWSVINAAAIIWICLSSEKIGERLACIACEEIYEIPWILLLFGIKIKGNVH